MAEAIIMKTINAELLVFMPNPLFKLAGRQKILNNLESQKLHKKAKLRKSFRFRLRQGYWGAGLLLYSHSKVALMPAGVLASGSMEKPLS
jgi:hypothetical protein